MAIVRRSACHVFVVLCAACAPARTGAGGGETPAASQLAVVRVESRGPTASAPRAWAAIDRDVVVLGQVPDIVLEIAGQRVDPELDLVRPRRVLGPDGEPVPRVCGATAEPRGYWGAASVDLRCVPLTRPGRYVVEVDLAAQGWGEEVMSIPIRVLSAPPEPRPVPVGWVSVPLSAQTPKLDCEDVREYDVELHEGRIAFVPYRPPHAPALPQALQARAEELQLRGVQYVEPLDRGFLIGSDQGEFGGGLQWVPSDGRVAIDLVVEAPLDALVSQNVGRLQRSGSKLYVLQGLAHLGISEGQLAAVWRERGRFHAHVIATYRSEPVELIRASEREWLVLTWNAVWKASEAGTNELVTRLPDVVSYPSSFVRMPDGVLLVGMREGVLRLTPLWDEAPRYAAEVLIPRDRHEQPCVGLNDHLRE